MKLVADGTESKDDLGSFRLLVVRSDGRIFDGTHADRPEFVVAIMRDDQHFVMLEHLIWFHVIPFRFLSVSTVHAGPVIQLGQPPLCKGGWSRFRLGCGGLQFL